MAMMMTSRSPWLPYPRREGRSVGARLFCLPHAGAGASAFRQWVRMTGTAEVEVRPIQPPGRETRRADAHYGDIAELIPDLAEALLPELDVPYAIFGNSVGAVLAFELAQRLENGAQRAPSRLIVAASASPRHAGSLLPSIDRLSDSELVELLAHRFQGIPAVLLDSPQLLAEFTPVMRRDLEAVQRYRAPELPALSCPVTAFVGEDDVIPRAFVDEWRAVTTGSFELFSVPGGHFAPLGHGHRVIDLTMRMAEI